MEAYFWETHYRVLAGKVATIGDLFSPMQSIQTCMESQGNAINDNLVTINNTIIGCVSALSESADLISNAAEDAKNDISKSINDLNKAIDKQLSSINPAKMKIGSSINTSLNEINKSVGELTNYAAVVNSQLGLTQKELNAISGKMLTAKDNDVILAELKAISGKMISLKSTDVVLDGIKNGVKASGNASKNEYPVSDNSDIVKMLKDINDAIERQISDIRNVETGIKSSMGTTLMSIKRFAGDSSVILTAIDNKVNESQRIFNDIAGKMVSQNDMDAMFRDLKDIMSDQMTAASATTVGMSGSLEGAMTNVMTGLGDILSAESVISNQLKHANRYLFFMSMTMRKMSRKGVGTKVDEMKDKLTGKAQVAKSKLLDVKGGKNVGDVIRAMAEAAVTMSKIPLSKSITLKRKVKGIFDAFFNTIKTHEKDMTPAKMKKYETAVISMRRISDKIHDMAKELAAITPIGVFAKMGAKMAGAAIRNLLFALMPLEKSKNIAKTEIAALTLKKIAKTLLEFTASMALSTVLAPIAIVGTKLTSIVIRSALLGIRPLGNAKNLAKTEIAAHNLKKIAASILLFEASMALTTILAPVAIVGTVLTGLLLKSVKFMLRPMSRIKMTKSVIQTAINLEIIGKSLLMFEASMALTTILAPVALIGLGLTALLIKGSQLLFRNMGSKIGTIQVRQGALNMSLMITSMILFTLAVLATTMITKYIITGGTGKINPANVVAFAGSIGVFALMFGSYMVFRKLGTGRGVMNVRKAAINILLMSASIIAFSLSILVADMITKQIIGDSLKSGKLTMSDGMGLVGVVGIYALMIGSYFVFRKLGSPKSSKDAFAGFGAIAAMSLGIILFAGAMYITHQISKSIVKDWKGGTDWKALVMDIAVFGLMLGSVFVYNRLGNPQNTKSAFAGFGAIAAMSLGFVLFSLALVISDSLIGNLWKTSDGKMDWGGLVKTVAVFGLMFGAMYIFKFAGKGNNMKDIMKGSAAVATMSIALGLFGFGLSFYTKSVENTGVDKLFMMPVLVGAFVGEFILAGKFFKNIMIGSGAVAVMAIGLGIFGYGIKFYVDAIKDVGWKQVGMMAALVGIFGAEFAVLGIPTVAGFVALGSAAVAAMSLGLYVFGDGVKHYVESIEKVGWKDVGKMAALIGIFGGEFALIGPLSPFIIASDAAFAIMGAALIPFSGGLERFASVMDNRSFDDIKKMATIIGVLGGEFALIGPLVPLVTLGSTAIGIMSGALTLLGKSMQEWSKTQMTEKQLNLICVSIDRLKLAFMGDAKGESRNDGGIKGFFNKIGSSISGAITGAFDLGPVTTTATAIGIISGALTLLGKSLQQWNDVKITEKQLNMICLSIDRIKLAFQGVDEKTQGTNMLGVLNGKISGALTSSFDIEKVRLSVNALTMAGFTIKELAKGIKEWMDTDIDMDKLTSLSLVLVSVRDIFSVLGDNGSGDTGAVEGWLKRKLAKFAPSDVEKGINATKKMGTAMTSIAEGLIKFHDVYATKFSDTKFMNEFTSAVATTVTSLSYAFKTIGESYSQQEVTPAAKWDLFGRMWQDLTVNTFGPKTRNAVQEGIKNVKGIGDALKDIAQGMKEFKDILPAGNDSFMVSVAAGISALLRGIQEPLIAFGTTDETFSMTAQKSAAVSQKYGAALSAIDDISAQTMNYEHHKVDVTAALQHVGEIGTLVKGLAEGAKILSDAKLTKDIGEYGVVNEDFKVDGGSGLVGNIQKLLCANLGVFVQLGKKVKEYGMHEVFEDQVVQDVQKGLFGTSNTSNKTVRVSKGEESYIGIAVQAAAGIGNVIVGLANGYKQMNDNFPSEEKMVEGVARVSKSIINIMDVFGNIAGTLTTGKSNAASSDPAMYSMVGDVPASLYYLNITPTDVFDETSDKINTIATGMCDSLNHVTDNVQGFNTFSKNVMPIMETMMNLMTMSTIFSTHKDGFKVVMKSGHKGYAYTLGELNDTILDSSEENAKIIANVSRIMSDAAPVVAKIKSSDGNSFVKFATSMTAGMNKLASTNKNVTNATKFVESLRGAVKEKVFDNISSNTERIANAINGLNNDIMKPYAEMIAGMGKLVEAEKTKTTQVLNEIKKTVEDIVEIVNKGGSGGGGNGGGSGSVGGGADKSAPKPQPQKPQEQKPVKVNVNTNIDATQFNIAVNKFAEAVDKMPKG